MSLVLVKSLEGFLWTCSSHLNLPSSATQNVALKLQNCIVLSWWASFHGGKCSRWRQKFHLTFSAFSQHVVCYNDYLYIRLNPPPQKQMYEIHAKHHQDIRGNRKRGQRNIYTKHGRNAPSDTPTLLKLDQQPDLLSLPQPVFSLHHLSSHHYKSADLIYLPFISFIGADWINFLQFNCSCFKCWAEKLISDVSVKQHKVWPSVCSSD